MSRQMINTDKVLDVPESVAVCPYCGGKLVVQFHTWQEQDDGTWATTGVDLDCETEPDRIESDDWSDWMERHTYMPYVYWLPVDEVVTRWVNANYQFNAFKIERTLPNGQ